MKHSVHPKSYAVHPKAAYLGQDSYALAMSVVKQILLMNDDKKK